MSHTTQNIEAPNPEAPKVPESLGDLKTGVIDDQLGKLEKKSALGQLVDLVKEGASKLVETIKNFHIGDIMKDINKGGGATFFAWFLRPFQEGDEENPEEAQKELEAISKEGDVLYKAYQEAPKGSEEKKKAQAEIRKYFVAATARHESGSDESWQKEYPHAGERVRYQIINIHAISDERKTSLEEKGIEVPKLAKIPFENGVPENYEEFKKEAVSKVQSGGVTSEKINNTVSILSRCAIGKYQILPCYHFARHPGWQAPKGEEGLKMIHQFLLNNNGEQELIYENLVNELGRKHDWNPLYMAAEYYGGADAAKALKQNPEGDDVNRDQEHGYSSIRTYAQKTVNLMNQMRGA